ncbi:MAG: amino acid ABC transporter ATP-binding protein, partial [Oscillospiraceae bacterium]
MNIIEIKNLCKSFKKQEILKDISLDIKKGDVVALIGNSGSGKSTLLRCLINLEKAEKGSIKIDDEYLIKDGILSDSKLLKNTTMKMGMVFQNYNLFPHLTVTQNLIMPYITVKSQDIKHAQQLCNSLLEKVNMLNRKDSYPATLSGGEKQRVAIARALMLNPEIMLFDEPTAALDPRLTNDIFEIISKISKEGKTIIIVTHELNFAKMVADTVVFMSDGKIEEMGTSKEIFNNPKNETLKS